MGKNQPTAQSILPLFYPLHRNTALGKENKKAKHIFHYEVMKAQNGGKQMKSVWQIAPPNKAEKQFGKHPTQKPTALAERCIQAASNIGDLIFDPFMGSGTTGVAALKNGREFLRMRMGTGLF